MLQLLRCALCLIVLLLLFTVWGQGVGKRLVSGEMMLPLQILRGFFSFFIVAQFIIIPMVFLHVSLHGTTIVLGLVVGAITIYMLIAGRRNFCKMVSCIHLSVGMCVALVVLACVLLVAIRQQYLGYDTCYYVGQMNAFLQYDAFWTRDAFSGMAETSVIPLHYALSCFYPLWSIVAYVFHIEARLMAMYTVRALCVVLFSCVAFLWGYELGGQKEKYGYAFLTICLLIGMFSLSEHSSTFMMMVRGYESKGYCAAVVGPMCAYALIRLFKNVESKENWRLLGMVAWASVPVAMSSLAVIPVAIAIGGIVMMIENRRFWSLFWRCFVCIVPNMIYMGWYVLGR